MARAHGTSCSVVCLSAIKEIEDSVEGYPGVAAYWEALKAQLRLRHDDPIELSLEEGRMVERAAHILHEHRLEAERDGDTAFAADVAKMLRFVDLRLLRSHNASVARYLGLLHQGMDLQLRVAAQRIANEPNDATANVSDNDSASTLVSQRPVKRRRRHSH